MNTFAASFLVAFCLNGLSHAATDGARSEPVHFARGAASTELKGAVKGYQTVDYHLDVHAGQTLTVTRTSGKAFFNINEPDAGDVSIFVGSRDGNRFKAALKYSGTYTIRVYQMRNTARRGVSANYLIRVAVHRAA